MELCGNTPLLPARRRPTSAASPSITASPGPMTVSKHVTEPIIYPRIMETARRRGFHILDDFHGATCEGYSTPDFNVHNGRRASTAVQYLRPAFAASEPHRRDALRHHTRADRARPRDRRRVPAVRAPAGKRTRHAKSSFAAEPTTRRNCCCCRASVRPRSSSRPACVRSMICRESAAIFRTIRPCASSSSPTTASPSTRSCAWIACWRPSPNGICFPADRAPGSPSPRWASTSPGRGCHAPTSRRSSARPLSTRTCGFRCSANPWATGSPPPTCCCALRAAGG